MQKMKIHTEETKAKKVRLSQLMCMYIAKCEIVTVVKINLVIFWFITSRTVLRDNRPDRLWNPHSLRCDGYQGSLLGLKRPGHEVDHSYLPSSEVKKKWSYSSTPPINDFMAWTLTNLSLPLHNT